MSPCRLATFKKIFLIYLETLGINLILLQALQDGHRKQNANYLDSNCQCSNNWIIFKVFNIIKHLKISTVHNRNQTFPYLPTKQNITTNLVLFLERYHRYKHQKNVILDTLIAEEHCTYKFWCPLCTGTVWDIKLYSTQGWQNWAWCKLSRISATLFK